MTIHPGRTLVVCAAALLALPSVGQAQPEDAVRNVETRTVPVRSATGLTHTMIVTRPQGASGRLPGILFVPWMDCDSVAIPAAKQHGIHVIMRHLVERSGFVVGRVNKPGVGGSEGDCARADLQTELAGYRAAVDALTADAWVAPGGVVLAGQSFSGGLLPLVADGRPVRGYVVMNSWVRTWLERLLEFERLRMERSGVPLDALAERMRLFSELYGIYLNERITPGDAIARRPRLAAVWEGPGTHQYGRIASFFHQLQALNLEAAWAAVRAPTLVMWGTADIAMHRVDHERIVGLVNAGSPGAATLEIIPGAGHDLTASGRVPDQVLQALDRWLAQFGPRRTSR
jgi:pimeloyl-ACP methyl ester carboxylesterase